MAYHTPALSKTYHVDSCVLELVLLFVVKDEAVLLDKAHDGRFPPRALEEGDKAIKDPILYTFCEAQTRDKININ